MLHIKHTVVATVVALLQWFHMHVEKHQCRPYPMGLGARPRVEPLVGVDESTAVGEGTDMLLSLSMDMSRLLSFI